MRLRDNHACYYWTWVAMWQKPHQEKFQKFRPGRIWPLPFFFLGRESKKPLLSYLGPRITRWRWMLQPDLCICCWGNYNSLWRLWRPEGQGNLNFFAALLLCYTILAKELPRSTMQPITDRVRLSTRTIGMVQDHWVGTSLCSKTINKVHKN